MLMHLGFSCVQKAFKIRLGADQILLRISIFFWNLFSLSSSYFYLLECSKIFFLISTYFIWVPHTLGLCSAHPRASLARRPSRLPVAWHPRRVARQEPEPHVAAAVFLPPAEIRPPLP
jgi:hypothetical protein